MVLYLNADHSQVKFIDSSISNWANSQMCSVLHNPIRAGEILQSHIFISGCVRLCLQWFIYIPWPFPPVWGVVDNIKKTTKQWGLYSVLLAIMRDPAKFGRHCWSDTAHPPPSSITYVASYATSPTTATLWQQQMPIKNGIQK